MINKTIAPRPATCYNHRDRTAAVATCVICQRIVIERRIVKKTVKALLAAGYKLNVDNGGDEDELPVPTASFSATLSALIETDDDFLKVFQGTSPDPNDWIVIGWVRFVYGNDGYDVISDYTVNLEDVLKPINDYADTLS